MSADQVVRREDVARLIRTLAARRGVAVPRRSTVRAAMRDAGISGGGTGAAWSKGDVARFAAALFPDRTARPLRRAGDGAGLFEERLPPSAPPPPPAPPVGQEWRRRRRRRRHGEPPPAPAVAAAPPALGEYIADARAGDAAAEDPDRGGVRISERLTQRAYLVHVDSADRDVAQYPDSNDFSVQLGNSDTAGLLRPFIDVEAVELVSVIIPHHTTGGGDNADDFPYVLLEVPELGGNFQATNMAATRAFAKLRFDGNLGAYREYRAVVGSRFRKDFHILRSLDRLTFRFFRPDGTPYDFGTGVLLRSRYARVTTEAGDGAQQAQEEVPMYFDGERWYKVPDAGNLAGDITTTQDPVADADLPDALAAATRQPTGVSIVLRVICRERVLQTSHMQRT
jgi:hypothetical protein